MLLVSRVGITLEVFAGNIFEQRGPKWLRELYEIFRWVNYVVLYVFLGWYSAYLIWCLWALQMPSSCWWDVPLKFSRCVSSSSSRRARSDPIKTYLVCSLVGSDLLSAPNTELCGCGCYFNGISIDAQKLSDTGATNRVETLRDNLSQKVARTLHKYYL